MKTYQFITIVLLLLAIAALYYFRVQVQEDTQKLDQHEIAITS